MESKLDTLMINNPWLAKFNLKTLISQYIVEDVSRTEIDILKKEFKKVYIFTIDDINFQEFFTNDKITTDEYQYIKNRLNVRQVSFSKLNNSLIKEMITIVRYEDLPKYYIDDKGIKTEFDENNVLLIVNSCIFDLIVNGIIFDDTVTLLYVNSVRKR